MKILLMDRIRILTGILKKCKHLDCEMNDGDGVCHIKQIWRGKPIGCYKDYKLMMLQAIRSSREDPTKRAIEYYKLLEEAGERFDEYGVLLPPKDNGKESDKIGDDK